MDRPEPVFLGFVVKTVVTRREWNEDPRVERVCSVSDCISRRPEGWQSRWDFNASGCYDSERAAMATLAEGQAHAFAVFTYVMFPLEFNAWGAGRPVAVQSLMSSPDPTIAPRADLADYDCIGYDAVSGMRAEPGDGKWAGRRFAFGHSPLSCNSMAREHPVNRHCLLDAWDDAVAAAAAFGKSKPEPPPYYIVQVFQRQGR